MARGGINEYQDPQTRRLIDSLIQQANKANNSSTLGGLASVLNQGMAGYHMGQDKRQRGAVNQVVAEEMAKKYSAPVAGKAAELIGSIDNESIMADPDEYPELAEKLSNVSGTGLKADVDEALMRREELGVDKTMNPTSPLAEQIDPSQLGGRTDLGKTIETYPAVEAQAGYDPHRSLMNRLVDMGGDNPYASRMGAQMGMQQAGADRAARIAAGVRDEGRTYAEKQKEIDFKRKSGLEIQKYLRRISDKRDLVKYGAKLKSDADLKKDYGNYVRDHQKAWLATGNKGQPPMSFEQWNSASSGVAPGGGQAPAILPGGATSATPGGQPQTLAQAQLAKKVSETTAVAQAKLDVKTKGVEKERKRTEAVAYKQFGVAMKNLEDKLGKMEYMDQGPIVGMAPAISTEAQNFEAARAAMAPILKQLFRGAGEGVFTNQDQQVLMRMLANRGQDAVPAKDAMNNVRRMVASKLGMPDPTLPKGDKPPKPTKDYTPEDHSALQWARENPNDERSIKILQGLGLFKG
tara:strand:- start:2013 stop:3575 length:1563 start_codon:yes stop_codon:yes gene_type:complete